MSEPIFKSIFGEDWDVLPVVMRRHYANHAYSDDTTIVEGHLDVMCRGILKNMAPIMDFLGQIPVRNEMNVPVTVHFQSDRTSKAFHFNRSFTFHNRTYIFRSRMMQIKGDEVIEIMHFGLGWKMQYSWDGQKVVLRHRGYALNVFGMFLPLPLTFILGEGYAEEVAVDDDTFDMVTHITHRWWGKIYEYKGRFKIVREPV